MSEIRWAYLRKNCTSCDRTRAYCSSNTVDIPEWHDARKAPIPADRVADVLEDIDTIRTGRGKATKTWTPGKDAMQDILADIVGRSGNLRAPAIKVGRTLLIGYNEEMYDGAIKP